jgi:hypothetical protein
MRVQNVKSQILVEPIVELIRFEPTTPSRIMVQTP